MPFVVLDDDHCYSHDTCSAKYGVCACRDCDLRELNVASPLDTKHVEGSEFMRLALDLGYYAAKWKTLHNSGSFLTVAAPHQEVAYGLSDTHESYLRLEDGSEWNIGNPDGGLTSQRQDSHWIESDLYRALCLYAFTEATTGSPVTFQITTGLPLTNFKAHREVLRSRLLGEFKARRGTSRRWQTFRVESVSVVPQCWGALFDVALSDTGVIIDDQYTNGHIGVVDIGSKTTGFVGLKALREVPSESGAVSRGAWDAIGQARKILEATYPDLPWTNYVAESVLRQNEVRYYGESYTTDDILRKVSKTLAENTIGEITTRWGDCAQMDAILVVGGGAHLIGQFIKERFPQVVVVDEPESANVRGYLKHAAFVARR